MGEAGPVGGDAAVVLEDVTLEVTRPVPTRILGPLRFAMDLDESVAVVGRSGAGKSSLVSILGGLLAPSGGAYRFCGRRIDQLGHRGRAAFRAGSVGFVFQAAHLIDDRTAVENVYLGTSTAEGGRRARRHAAHEALDAVGLAEVATRPARYLSGGERQRVAVARALVTRPRLVIADEPTGNLDLANGDRVLDVLLGATAGRAGLVLVTHDQRSAARAGRRVTIRDGHLVADDAGTGITAEAGGAPP